MRLDCYLRPIKYLTSGKLGKAFCFQLVFCCVCGPPKRFQLFSRPACSVGHGSTIPQLLPCAILHSAFVVKPPLSLQNNFKFLVKYGKAKSSLSLCQLLCVCVWGDPSYITYKSCNLWTCLEMGSIESPHGGIYPHLNLRKHTGN